MSYIDGASLRSRSAAVGDREPAEMGTISPVICAIVIRLELKACSRNMDKVEVSLILITLAAVRPWSVA